MTMVRKQLYLTPEQDAKLKSLARMSGKTEAEVMRAALDAFAEHADPVMAALRDQGLLAEPPQAHLTPAEAQELYAEYSAWALEQLPLELSAAVLAEREEGR
jgi:antitoxin ParD1/3/4